MSTINKGDTLVGDGSGNNTFSVLSAPVNGNYFVADSTQTLGWRSQVAAPALKAGNATLVAGTVVVTDSAVTASSNILLTAQASTSIGALRVTSKTAGTGFTIISSVSADTGVVSYLIIG